MKRFVFIIILVIAAIGLTIAAFTYFRGENKTPVLRENIYLHHYSDKNLSLENISIKAVYFVPNDEKISPEWKTTIVSAIESLKKFHEFQFSGYSKIEYEVVAEPFEGKKDHLSYDTENTNKGNPEALKRTVAELEEKYPKISEPGARPGGYNVLLIFYQGVGAVSSENVVLAGYDIFTNKDYEIFKDSILYHEFGHVIGLPDQYNEETGRSFGYDIMGLGRNGPLENSYIDLKILRSMGLY
jgi:hypothetical protein